MEASIRDHIDSLGTQKEQLSIDESRMQGEFANQRIDFDAKISEMERIAEKYPDATIGYMCSQKIVMSPSVNSRVDSVCCTDFANSFNNDGHSEIEGYFYLQDGATKVYSSPATFNVGYYSYDSEEDEANHTRYDDWMKEAASAGISPEMIEKLDREVISDYFSQENTPDL
jgi:hypothetical protein